MVFGTILFSGVIADALCKHMKEKTRGRRRRIKRRRKKKEVSTATAIPRTIRT
jgi:hypothetical protein